MSFKLLNRVRMSVSGSPGTGLVTLNSQAIGFQSFSNGGMNDGDQTPYLIEDGNPLGSAWEIGVGTWHSNGTFSRTTITQSSAGGTTALSLTSSAVVSAIFRAQDLQGTGTLAGLTDVNVPSPTDGYVLTYQASSGKWVALAPPGQQDTPSVVQAAPAVSAGNTVATVYATLTSAPTYGNVIMAIGYGGGSSGNGLGGTDWDWVYHLGSGATALTVALRAVRLGDGTSVLVGSTLTSGPALVAAVCELSYMDVSRFVQQFISQQQAISGSTISANVLSASVGLTLGFYGSNAGTVAVGGSATSLVNATDGGDRVALSYQAPATPGYDTVSFSMTSSSNPICAAITIPGFF